MCARLPLCPRRRLSLARAFFPPPGIVGKKSARTRSPFHIREFRLSLKLILPASSIDLEPLSFAYQFVESTVRRTRQAKWVFRLIQYVS